MSGSVCDFVEECTDYGGVNVVQICLDHQHKMPSTSNNIKHLTAYQ